MARLGDVCKLVSGNSLPETIVAEKGELPYVKVAELNLAENTPNITTSRQFVSATDISAKQIVPVGTVIFPKRGGAIGTNKKRLVSTPICMDLNLMGVIPSSKLYPQYLYYFFENIDMGALSNGSSVPQINNSDIAPLEIRIPDITTQKDIATRLDKVTELIALRKEQLAKLDQLVKSRFIELFGDPMENPMRWDRVNISAVVGGKVSNGFFAKRDDYCDSGNVKVLGVAHVVNRMYSNIEDLPTTNGTEVDVVKYGVKYGDMLFCRSSLVAAGIGKASIVPKNTPNNVLFECHVIRLPLDLNKCVPEFMQVLSTTEYFRNQVIAQAKTATMTTIGQDGILKTNIVLPPLEMQKKFLAFIEQTDKSKLAIQQSLDKLELLKKSLMQEYFG